MSVTRTERFRTITPVSGSLCSLDSPGRRGSGLSSQEIADQDEQEPGVEHDRPGPREARIDGGEPLEILQQHKEKPCHEAEQAELFLCRFLHAVSPLFFSLKRGYGVLPYILSGKLSTICWESDEEKGEKAGVRDLRIEYRTGLASSMDAPDHIVTDMC